MKFYRYLTEKSYDTSNIPNKFWLVFDLKETAKELVKGIIKDVKGISDNRRIVTSFLGVARDAMLIMPGKELVNLNKLSRVLYDNTQYLLSNNMAALARIFNSKRDLHNVIFNIFNYVQSYWAKKGNQDEKTWAYDFEYSGIHQELAYHIKTNPPRVNGTRDLAKWAIKSLNEIYEKQKEKTFGRYYDRVKDIPLKQMEKGIIGGLNLIGNIYKDEGEWVIKNDSLKIPNNSTLFVLKSPLSSYDFSVMDYMEKIDNDTKGYKKYLEDHSPQVKIINDYKLDRKYNVKYYNAQKFEKVRAKIVNKR